VVIPSAIVEPAIAASIVYVAVENFFSRNIDKRWHDTFAFGLIHGFGFASALQEFGLSREALVPALGAFNLGVEVGQVAIVCLVMPALIGLDWLSAASRGSGPTRLVAFQFEALHQRLPHDRIVVDDANHRSGPGGRNTCLGGNGGVHVPSSSPVPPFAGKVTVTRDP
jgi:hypothetical protein